MKTLVKILIISLFVPLFVACDMHDDDRDYMNYRIDLGTVENPDSSAAFYIVLDNKSVLWVKDSNFSDYKPANGQRVIATYTVLSDKHTTDTYDYDVKLLNTYNVLTKNIFNVTAQTQDSIGNDYIQVEDMWIGSDYLNVQFVYAGYNQMHFINLVSDSTKTYTDGKIHLGFRHNANFDSPIYYKRGYASFRLKPLRDKFGQDTLHLVIHVNEAYTASAKTIEFTYSPQNNTLKMAASHKLEMPEEKLPNIR